MQAPMDIAQFNALLHSKKDQTQLLSALHELTSISDLEVLNNIQIAMGGWGGWP
jgi:hypothetical protein